jgi:hypothetical protein
VTSCVRKFLDLVQMCNRVTSHGPTHRRRSPSAWRDPTTYAFALACRRS